MILTSLAVDRGEFEARSGWDIKPEGACRGDVCVPLPSPADDTTAGGTTLDATVLSATLGMPLLHDERHGLWSLGPSTATGRVLASAQLPEITLPDLRTGDAFSVSSLRGRKVLLLAWASW